MTRKIAAFLAVVKNTGRLESPVLSRLYFASDDYRTCVTSKSENLKHLIIFKNPFVLYILHWFQCLYLLNIVGYSFLHIFGCLAKPALSKRLVSIRYTVSLSACWWPPLTLNNHNNPKYSKLQLSRSQFYIARKNQTQVARKKCSSKKDRKIARKSGNFIKTVNFGSINHAKWISYLFIHSIILQPQCNGQFSRSLGPQRFDFFYAKIIKWIISNDW